MKKNKSTKQDFETISTIIYSVKNDVSENVDWDAFSDEKKDALNSIVHRKWWDFADQNELSQDMTAKTHLAARGLFKNITVTETG